MTQRLEAEGVSARLAADLTKAGRNLQAESDELGLLSAALKVVCDDLEVVRSKGTSSLVARAIDITVWVRQLKRDALCAGVTQAFAIARSHYADNIDLEMMSLGFTPGYEASELDEIEAAVTPLAATLASKVEDMVPPRGGSKSNRSDGHCF